MAEPDIQVQGGDEGEGGGKGSKLPLIIIIFVVLLAAIGAVFYFLVLKKDTAEGGPKLTPRPTPGMQMPMTEAFTVNLQPDGVDIATIKMVFEIRSLSDDVLIEEAAKEWMPPADDNRFTLYPKIRDVIMAILRSKTKTELNSSAGVEKTKDQIINTLNQDVLSKSQLSDVSFTSLVIQ